MHTGKKQEFSACLSFFQTERRSVRKPLHNEIRRGCEKKQQRGVFQNHKQDFFQAAPSFADGPFPAADVIRFTAFGAAVGTHPTSASLFRTFPANRLPAVIAESDSLFVWVIRALVTTDPKIYNHTSPPVFLPGYRTLLHDEREQTIKKLPLSLIIDAIS